MFLGGINLSINQFLKISTVASSNLISFKIAVVALTFLCVCSISVSATVFTNEFAVHVEGGEEDAENLAKKHGFVFRGQIGSLNGYYLFENHNIQKRSLELNLHHHNLLENDPSVLWVEQQHAKRRTKRDVFEESTFQLEFPDPLYPDQWFLHGGGYGGYDMNVLPAWKDGYTGKGVVVSILDDGIQTNHPDLAQNYDKLASLDINGKDNDPMPQDNDDNKHGTRCAGEVAAVAFNEFCGVGIAYNASIGGVRMLDGTVTDVTEAIALSHNPDHIHIYSASWGPEDDGKTVDGPGPLAKLAFADGIKKGRSGLGSIFVWASGNGGRNGDSCNCDGYTNSIYTLAISSATQGGTKPWYLEQCSSTLATTYSSGTAMKDKSITTVDMDNTYFADLAHNHQPNPLNLCTKSHTGTSASAPIAAGICALALEANPKLTWRDMQFLVLMTSRPEPLDEIDWVKNGVGRFVSSKFGYGLMDAAAMVKLAKQWVTVPPQVRCESSADTNERIIPAGSGEHLEVSMNVDSCKNSKNAVKFLEHVQVKVTLYFKPRGNLKITLISPAETASTVLLPRSYDVQEGSFSNWPFMSVHFWGENGEGLWKLRIINTGDKKSSQPGKLTQWALVFYGTNAQPVNLKQTKRNEYRSPGMIVNHYTNSVPHFPEIDDGTILNQCLRPNKFQVKTENGITCVQQCPEGMYGDLKDYKCHPCDKSCESCYGPSYDNCLSCPEKLFLSKNFCEKSCPDDMYADTLKKACLPCANKCSTCHSTRDSCITCKAAMHLHKQSCTGTCPNGTFLDKSMNICKNCHSSCTSCFGVQENECLMCNSDKSLFKKTCVSTCPEGFYSNEYRHCTKCHRSCKTCADASSCIECSENWKQIYYSGLCVWNMKCPKGWYNANSNACEPCLDNCAVCNRESEDCFYCETGYYFTENVCEESCPEGSYANKDECSSCKYFSDMCLKCSKDQCLLCEDGFVLHNGNCFCSCPSGFYSNGKVCLNCDSSCMECASGTMYHCTSCPPNRYLFNNTCKVSCPDGFFAHDKSSECIPCYYLCKTCNGFSPLDCTSCYKHASFNDGICVPCLDDEFYDESSQQCQRCHDKCGRCDGQSEYNCLSCRAPLRLDESNHSCLPCCTNKFSPKFKCCTCSRDLDICLTSGDHPRSIGSVTYDSLDLGEIVIPLNHVAPVIIAICAFAVLLFVILFGILQARSAGWCRWKYQGTLYRRLPNKLTTGFDSTLETVSLTQDEPDEEDDIYEKA